MDHGGFDAKNIHDDEGKVVVRGDVDEVAGGTRILAKYAGRACLFTVCVYRCTHLRRREFVPIRIRSADRDIEEQFLRIRDGYKA